jgi:phosphoglycolate phosphatase-like HAD superfamily hydrolase
MVSLAGFAVADPLGAAESSPADPLPSWSDGSAKKAILSFVGRVSVVGGSDYVDPADRIAVFDNDGTLWAEQPVYFQFAFALDEIRRLAPNHPDWASKEPFRSVLAGDIGQVMASGQKGLAEVLAVTHSGMTTGAFADSVSGWFATARHPKLKMPYDKLVYAPQIELLGYLRSKGFKTFIVSGGGVEFMRVFARRAYGIPPAQVVGSSGVVRFQMANGEPELIKEPKIEFIDDGPGKPVGINRFIGQRPIFAFGNSDGDLEMLEYTGGGEGPRLMAILHHTDAEREWAYDRQSPVGKLDKALDMAIAKGWTVVSMKDDWNRVF